MVSALSVVGGMLSHVVGSWLCSYKRSGEWRWFRRGWASVVVAVWGCWWHDHQPACMAYTLGEEGTLLAFRSNLLSLRGVMTSVLMSSHECLFGEKPTSFFWPRPCISHKSYVQVVGETVLGEWSSPGEIPKDVQASATAEVQAKQCKEQWGWWVIEMGQMKGRKKTGSTEMRFC